MVAVGAACALIGGATMVPGSMSEIRVTTFLATAAPLAVVAPDGGIMLTNTAWLQYGEHSGAGPRGAVGANFWHLTRMAAIRGDQVAAIASDGLEAALFCFGKVTPQWAPASSAVSRRGDIGSEVKWDVTFGQSSSLGGRARSCQGIIRLSKASEG